MKGIRDWNTGMMVGIPLLDMISTMIQNIYTLYNQISLFGLNLSAEFVRDHSKNHV